MLLQTEAQSQQQSLYDDLTQKKTMLERELNDTMQQFNQTSMQLQNAKTDLTDSKRSLNEQQALIADLRTRLEQTETESKNKTFEMQILHDHEQHLSARVKEVRDTDRKHLPNETVVTAVNCGQS